MLRRIPILALAISATAAYAQPEFITLPGSPGDLSADGSVVVGMNGGPFRWVRTGSSATYTVLLSQTIGGNAFCSDSGGIVSGTVPNTDLNAGPLGFAVTALWSGSTFVEQHDINLFPGTGSPNTINFHRSLTRDGRFIAGVGYLSAGIGGYRGMIHDSMTGVGTRLNPVLDLTNTGTRALCISDDALVVGGDDGTTGSAQRPCIWRRASLADPFVGQVLEVGTGGPSGATVNCMSADGSKASGRSYFDTTKLVRWVWNSTTNQYDKVILATVLANSATALTRVDALAMTPDGDTIFGQYNGSRSFIWTAASGQMRDLTTDLVSEGITGMPAGYVAGTVTSCSEDGREFIVLGGLGSPSGVVYRDGGIGCVQPSSTPVTSTTTVSTCSRTIIINASAAGTGPFTYQHRKNGVPIVVGPTGNVDANGVASTYSVSEFSPSQLRVNDAGPLDAGTYDVVITNACGSTTTPPHMVTAEPQGPYDTCADPFGAIGAGSITLPPLCGAYVNESPASCGGATQRADMWVRFTAVDAGDYRITTCGQSNFDLVLSTFNTCGGAETACNDNFCSSLPSIERVTLAAGQSVLIRVGAKSTVPTAGINLIFELLPPPPPNDLCAGATLISAAGAYPWDNTFAGTDGSASCNVNSGKDVWFNFTPTANGTASFNTCGSLLNTVMSIHDGCGGTQLACNDNANVTGCTFQSAINSFTVIRGRSYLVRIAANTASGIGTGNLTVTFTPSACQADFNGDGNLDPDDLSDYITCFFSVPVCPGTDYNGDTNVDPDDLSDYITAFFTGC